MPELRFEPTAAANLEALYQDPTKVDLADRIDQQLDLLETEPENPALTGTEFRSRFGLIYAVRIFGNGDDWMLLWKRQDADSIRVYYAGPTGSI